MKKALKLPYILTGLAVIFLILQVFRIDKTKPQPNTEADYITIAQPPAEITSLIKSSCYDCHSNETKYPWYSNIAPVSWILQSHIKEGRAHLNFSEWGNYQPGKQGNKQDECKEMLAEEEMPLLSYKLMHSSANFTEEQKTMLVKWFTNE
jgi:hypothetical protein